MLPSLCCERIEVGLPEYLDGVLPGELRYAFESHLAVCVECWQEWHRLHAVRGLLGSLSRPEMPAPMKRKVLRALAGTGAARGAQVG